MARKRGVKCLDMNKVVIEYKSVSDAVRATGQASTNICKVANGKRRKCHGMLWAYSDEEFNMDNFQYIIPYSNKFLLDVVDVHPVGLYTYLSKPTGSTDDVSIFCTNCKSTFTQTVQTHLYGSGCNICASKAVGDSQTMSKEECLELFHSFHGDKFDYSHITKFSARHKVILTCPEHGSFNVVIGKHRRGTGCPFCNVGGFNSMLPAMLYYVKVVNKGIIAYKIGITNRTVKKRFLADFKYITVLKTWDYELGADALQAEQNILRTYKEFKYEGLSLLVSGNTELFYKDIMDLDE